LAAVAHAGLPLEQWRDLLAGGPRVACFLPDPSAFYELTAGLGGNVELLDTGEAVNRWMHAVRASLVDLDACFEGTEGDPLWQASDLAERNPSVCGVNYLACAWLAGIEALSTPRQPIVFVVGHSGLGLALLREAEKLGYRTDWRHPDRWVHAWPGLAGFWRKARLLWGGIKERWRHLRQLRERKACLDRMGFPRPGPGVRDRLVAVWAGASTFPPAAPLRRDPYYGSLPGHLRDRGERTLFLAVPLSWVDSFEDIARSAKASPEEVFLPEHCMGTGQALLDALRTLVWKPRQTRPFLLAGRDASWLLRDALWEERSKARQMQALQFMHVAPGLASLGVRPRGLLHLYENQPWEKLLRMGVRRSFPDCPCTGYMHAPFSRNYISFLPSKKDRDSGNMPDRLVTPGRAWVDIMGREGLPPERLFEGPSLRLGHLFPACPAGMGLSEGSVAQESVENSAGSKGVAVLMAGSMDLHEFGAAVRFLLPGALRAFPELRAWVKPHPKAPARELAALRSEVLPGGACFTTRPADELLPLVDAVLHCGSTLALEALCLGKHPVFLAPPAGLDMDKLDWFPGAGLSIRTSGQLASAMRAIAGESPAQARARWARGRQILQDLFNPVSEGSLKVFLQH
jgi:hypothetical protein